MYVNEGDVVVGRGGQVVVVVVPWQGTHLPCRFYELELLEAVWFQVGWHHERYFADVVFLVGVFPLCDPHEQLETCAWLTAA